MKLRELGEDRLIARLVAPLRSRSDVMVGPGDDCAVVVMPASDRLLLLKTDCVVEGVHFRADEKPAAVGWKAMMRTLSDFAAMSGVPQHALVTLVAPAEREVRWVGQLYGAMERAARCFDVAIVGGETSSTSGPVMLSIGATGSVEKERCVLRSGGRAGDALFVTGKLGGSGRRRHLNFMPRIAEARWLTRHFRLHAMMDLSDGLGADLPRLAEASELDFEIDEAIVPRSAGCSINQAINDGEDYELLFALSPNDAAGLEKKWHRRFPKLLLTRIGCLKARGKQPGHRKMRTSVASVARKPLSFHGYHHFQ
jgi:thiamine-monophosphate kinase